MKLEDWKRLPFGHMKPHEPWGDTYLVNFYLVCLMDHLRENLGVPIYVTYGTQGKHKGPWHARGLAVDCVIDRRLVSPLDVLLQVTRLPFTGFGIIPEARHPNIESVLGLHLDVRPHTKLIQPQARWIWSEGADVPLTAGTLKQFGLL